MGDFFRREAVEAAANRMAGEVNLVTGPSLQLLALIAAGVAAAALAGAALAPIDRTIAVEAALVPERGLIQLTAQHGGTVRRVLLQPGAMVAAGTSVLSVRLATEVEPGADAAGRYRTDSAVERQGILRASEASASDIRRKIADIDRDVAAKRRDRALLADKAEIQAQQVAIAERAVKDATALADRGYLAGPALDQRRSTLLSNQAALIDYRRLIAAGEAEIAQLSSNRAALSRELSDVGARREEALAKWSREAAAAFGQGEYFVPAPLGGVLASVFVRPGEPLAAGQVVAAVAPPGGGMTLEMEVTDAQLAELRPGQVVRARVTSATGGPRRVVRAVVSTIGPVPLPAGPGVAADPRYRVIARVEDGAGGMAPGSRVQARIVVRRTTLLGLLFQR